MLFEVCLKAVFGFENPVFCLSVGNFLFEGIRIIVYVRIQFIPYRIFQYKDKSVNST